MATSKKIKKTKPRQVSPTNPKKGKIPLTEIFVQYPPKDLLPLMFGHPGYGREIIEGLKSLPSPYIWLWGKNPRAWNKLSLDEFKFNKSNSSIHAIIALVQSHEAGVYPPLWALKSLYEGLNEWLRKEAKEPLDKCLGLMGKKGELSQFTKLRKDTHDSELCFAIFFVAH